MSRLADYSKFDNLDDSDDDAPAPAPPQQKLDPQGIPEGAQYTKPTMTNHVRAATSPGPARPRDPTATSWTPRVELEVWDR